MMNNDSTPSFGRRYSRLRSLGSGAQGVVYVAEDRFLGGDLVAIKALRPVADKEWGEAFRHEFEVLAGLSHHRLARVHDFGSTEEGHVYFTRDYVEGDDLRAATKKMGVKSLLGAFIEVCRALKPLHSRGLLHGDLKPGNVIFSRDGVAHLVSNDGVAHLIDFSFVCASGEDAKRQGTVQYMAPEVIEGRPVDPRADLYALGITIIDIIFGEPPFDGTVSQIVGGHLGDERPRFDNKKSRLQNADSPELLKRIISVATKLISRDPDDRFPDILEVEAALSQLSKDTEYIDPLPEYPVVSDPLGRDKELQRVKNVVEQRLEKDRGAPVLSVVLGEFGTGKTALLRNIKWWAELEGIAVVEARSATGLLEPIARLVDQALDYIQSDSVTVNLGEYLVDQLSRPDVASTNLDRLTQESARLLIEVAKKKRLLVELSDLEQASPETIRVLGSILALIGPSVPMAVLVTAEASFSWREKLGQGEVFELPVLGTSQIARLTESFLGRADPNVVERVEAHTGGNPLFVEALLKDLAASGEGAERLEQLGPPRQLEAYWRDQLDTMTQSQRRFLEATAVIDRAASVKDIVHVAGLKKSSLESVASTLETEGWLRRGADGWHMATAPLAKEVMAAADSGFVEKCHKRAMKIESSEAKKLLHAVRGRQVDLVKKKGLTVAKSLENVGAFHAAVELLSEMEQVLSTEEELTSVRLSLGGLHLAQGNYEKAISYLNPLAENERHDVRCQALLALGSIHARYGKLDESSACLDQVLDIGGSPSDTARAYRELANVEFKRGNLLECVSSAQKGLECAPARDIVRAKLLIVLAKEAAHSGRHEDALARSKEAVSEARLTGDRYCLALAVDMLSWVLGQSGDLVGAVTELEQAVSLYRELGNLPRLMRDQLALGDMKWRLENWHEALQHYEEAGRLTATQSNPVEALLVEIGLGFALVKTGRFEQAKLIIDRAGEEADRLGQEELRLHTVVYRGDLLAARGDVGEALSCYEEAHQGFEQLVERSRGDRAQKGGDADKGGWTRWQAALADLDLDIAGWLLWRDGPKDREEAKRHIDSAASRTREDRGRLFEENLALRQGALAIAEGRVEAGIEQLDILCKKASGTKAKNIKWQAHLAAAKGYLKLNSDFLARRRLRQAEMDLDALSELFTHQQSLSFWQDVRRAEVRRLLDSTAPSSDYSSTVLEERASEKLDWEARALYRVLEFNQQLSAEHELPRLLEAILDAAVDLTGAERGLVLMAPKSGEGPLEIRASKLIESRDSSDPHDRFSRSIAESVHLDGEPVVTIDAMGDERFNEFISIHELRLKSVACMPVRYRGEALGVLYLENRLKTGRFSGSDLRVLSAFSDQVAIAIAQTRLLDEAKKREVELQRARQDLEEAFDKQKENLHSHKVDLKLARERLERLRLHMRGQGDYHGAVGTGEDMERVFSLLDRVKDLDVPVVFVGESGTGKDLLTRILHDESSRKEGPFVVMNCGSVPETLLESTLFGHVKGAFSGASSDQLGILRASRGGTLYLDEIGDMSPRMQVDLLRVLQEGKFTPLGASEAVDADFRLVASSKIPLDDLVKAGRLRQDLLYRLQVVTVEIPPLRRRAEDILPLARRMIDREATQSNLTRRPLSKEAAEILMKYDWPGNVRELEQSIRRVIIIGDGQGPITARELGIEVTREAGGVPTSTPRKSDSVPESEKDRIVDALERCQWNRTRAAKELGIPRRTFYRKIEKLGIVSKK